MKNPLISCIIPTYNRANLLREAIESTLRQTYPRWELVIVDDQSTDGTKAVVESYVERDSRIKYFLNPRKGLNAARNYGLAKAKGEYIAFLDDDDISLPHRFESQINAIKRSGCQFLVSGFQLRDRGSEKVLSENKLELKAAGASFPSRWMVKKSLLDKVGGFDEEFPSMTDPEVSYRIKEYEIFALHNDIVSIMYRTPGSVSRVKTSAVLGKRMIIEKYEKRIPPLEIAWWCYVTGLDYYALGKMEEAKKFLSEAAKRDSRGIYKWANIYFSMTHFLPGLLKRINLKVLGFLAFYRYPILVDHRIV